MIIEQIKENEIEETCKMIAHTRAHSDFAKFYPPQYIDCTYKELKWRINAGHFYVVKEEGKIIGCGGVAPFWNSLVEGWIHSVFVAPEYQRKGIGRQIVEFLENDEYARGTYRIEIHSAMSAIPFFRKLGYRHKKGQLIYEDGRFDLEKYKCPKFEKRSSSLQTDEKTDD